MDQRFNVVPAGTIDGSRRADIAVFQPSRTELGEDLQQD